MFIREERLEARHPNVAVAKQMAQAFPVQVERIAAVSVHDDIKVRAAGQGVGLALVRVPDNRLARKASQPVCLNRGCKPV
jgi:hypothetical protein